MGGHECIARARLIQTISTRRSPATLSRALGQRHLPAMHRTAAAVVLALALAGCEDSVTGPAPPPDGPTTVLLLKRTVAYFAHLPTERQAGEYFYDAERRLERFEFSRLIGSQWWMTIRQEYLHQPDGRPAGYDNYQRLDDGSWWHNRVVRYGYQGSADPVEVRIEEVAERTGEVVESVWELQHDAYGRLTEIRKGTETETLTYDANGDVVRTRTGGDTRFNVLIQTLTYGDAWNPFAAFPPVHGALGLILAPGVRSLHVSTGFTSGVEGEAPAATGTATVTVNEYGYPTRWEVTFWNVADPNNTTTAITEFEYYEP